VDEPKLDLIGSYAQKYLVWLEYGLQSVHDTTLAFINRGHTLKDFENAVAMTRGRGIQICAHVILGLPGETRDMMLDTARYLAGAGIHGVKIHLLYVIKGTPLDRLFLAGKYQPMTQPEYVETVCDFLALLPEQMVIQRITGDPHGSELRAPAWAGRYRETFNLIQQALDRRDTFQGKKYQPETPA
jgi:radical SAM protein (TIGR01212 family)